MVHQLQPVFVAATSLRTITGFPVLGSVSLAFQNQHRAQRLRELGAFLGVTSTILIGFLLVVIFEDVGVQLGEEIRRRLEQDTRGYPAYPT